MSAPHPTPPHLGDDRNFRTFIETIDEIVLIASRQGRIVYTNPATTRILGFTPAELLDMAVPDIHPEWCREEAVAILGEMLDGRRQSCPLPLRGKDGRIVPVETRVWFGRWSGQDCIFGLCKNLSAQQEALEKFEKVFRVNPAPMALSDGETRRFLEINAAYSRVLGWEPDDVVGRTVFDLDMAVDPEAFRQAGGMMSRYGVIRDVPLQVRSKDGKVHDGLFSGEVIRGQGRTYLLTVMVDVTAQRKAEFEREQVIRELRSALDQIEALQRILPICAHCKKIRDDQGYWQQVEAYVSSHTGARFSHGICPDCREEHFGDL